MLSGSWTFGDEVFNREVRTDVLWSAEARRSMVVFKSVGAGVDIVVAIVRMGGRYGAGVLVAVCEKVCRGCLFWWFLFTMILLLLPV